MFAQVVAGRQRRKAFALEQERRAGPRAGHANGASAAVTPPGTAARSRSRPRFRRCSPPCR
jgi:hypothetical protein